MSNEMIQSIFCVEQVCYFVEIFFLWTKLQIRKLINDTSSLAPTLISWTFVVYTTWSTDITDLSHTSVQVMIGHSERRENRFFLIKIFYITARKMNKQLVLIFMFAVIMIAVISSTAAHDHFAWNNCQCQSGGERGGHCHCAWNDKPAGVDCREGSNHWICFPNIF